MKKLPIWIQTFWNIRESWKTIYIDKTKHILQLINSWDNPKIFLSRPRRFWKSLLIDTIRCLFEWKKELFKWLYAYDKWDFDDKYPVIKIAFGDAFYKNTTVLQNTLNWIINKFSIKYNLNLIEKNIGDKFWELIRKLYEKTWKQVVVLVDEYDKPILDKIDDIQNANEIKEELKWFYSVLKWADEYLRFVILTWVTKFSKVSVFSWLNNLNDITLDPKYNNICWYTIDEIKDNFWPEWYLDWLDFEKMKNWYNWYSFWWTDTLYNPFWLLLFFDKEKEYSNYWFQSATPTFLLKLLKKQKYSLIDFENLEVWEEITWSFDIERLDLVTLMFQTWYLTIKWKYTLWWGLIYKLWIPNKEVRMSLNNYLIKDYILFEDYRKNLELTKSIYKNIEAWDVEWLIATFKKIYAWIPYANYVNNKINEYEGFYASVLYAFLTWAWVDFVAEDFTNRWRIDFTISYLDYIIIIELKVEKTWEKALEQIKEKKYSEKYIEEWRKIILLGIDFDEIEKNIWSYEFEIV